MSDQPSIEPSLARIDRANENIRNLDRKCREFIDSRPYEIVAENDSDSHVHTVTVVRIHDALPLRVRAGEIAHHLRAAFDLLVYQLMLYAGISDDSRLRNCAFPVIVNCDFSVTNERKKYESTMRRKIEGIHPNARARIEGLQPCIAGNGGGRSFLAQIDSLDNTDKHRLLLAVVSAVNIGNWRWNDGTEPAVVIPPRTYLPLQSGAIFKFGPTTPEMHVNLETLPVPLEVTFGEPGIVCKEPVVPALQNLSDLSRSAIRLFQNDFH
jgi:hypothetical protein